MSFANFVGTRILKQNNRRTCVPPGSPIKNGRKNILVATATRSGTHLLIDLLLNNLPEYRRAPLYVDLDSWGLYGRGASLDLSAAGYIIKTHYPSSRSYVREHWIRSLAEESVLVTVHRPIEQIRKSLERWIAAEPELGEIKRHLDGLEQEIREFTAFWSQFSPYCIEFKELFEETLAVKIIADLAKLTGSDIRPLAGAAVPLRDKKKVYLNKALTRLLGRHAPRIDTTIRAFS